MRQWQSPRLVYICELLNCNNGHALSNVLRPSQRWGQILGIPWHFMFHFFFLCLSLSRRGWSDGLSRLECGTNCHSRPKTQLNQFNKHSYIIVNSSLESCPSTTTCHPSCFTKHSDRKEEAKVWAVAEQVVVVGTLRYITKKQQQQNTRYSTLCCRQIQFLKLLLNVSLIL